MEERCALWSITHIMLNTCLRDGLTLQPLEFVSVKKQQGKFEKSACIVSEFSGCGKALQGAFIINPYDVEAIAIKIDEAINTSA